MLTRKRKHDIDAIKAARVENTAKRQLAFAMGAVKRLGDNSVVSMIEDNVLQLIIEELDTDYNGVIEIDD
jgi:hypothetical protein